MASNQKCKLSLLPFPQRWDEGVLSLNIVVLPRGNPLVPLMTGIPSTPDGPAFADSILEIRAMLIPGLEELPKPGNVALKADLHISAPADMRYLYESLSNSVEIDPHPQNLTENPRRSGRQIKKYLVPSYRNAFAFSGQKTEFAKIDDSYACALSDPCRLKRPLGPHPGRKTVWGRIIAQALRQPVLAARLGLLYKVDVKLPDAFFKDGGWLYLDLSDSSHFARQAAANPELLCRYAARIPPLDPLERKSRDLFAALLFPVSDTTTAANFDELFAEAASYDDGFAKIVHCAQQTTAELVGLEKTYSQPVITDSGIMLGWDDEQILIWLNRQIADPSIEIRNSPLGVMGYRIDVREKATSQNPIADWTSLMWASANLSFLPKMILSGQMTAHPLGKFKGELTVEAKPLQLDNRDDGDYWLPTYFAQWNGNSLVVADPLAMMLSGVKKGDLKGLYEPIGLEGVSLQYGRRYEFRVRLADISGGGPGPQSNPQNPSPAPISECHFRRYVAPREVIVGGRPTSDAHEKFITVKQPVKLQVARPRIGYPAAIFTRAANARDKLEKDLKDIISGSSQSNGGRPSIPDPDVEAMEICIQVASPELDPENNGHGHPALRCVHTFKRNFPANPDDPIDLLLVGSDMPKIENHNWEDDDLVIQVPTARDVVVTLKAICREDTNLEYFGSEESRFGRPTDIRLRFNSFDESDFFAPDKEENRMRAIFLRQDDAMNASLLSLLASVANGEEAETDIMSRLAAELGLTVNGTTLMGRPGRRTIFGCSSAISHIIAPDQSAITFSSKADLILRWITVINLRINRDWTWNNGDISRPMQFMRGNDEVGSMRLPMIVNPSVFSKAAHPKGEPETGSVKGDNIDRNFTEVFFFDAIDPKPKRSSTTYDDGFPHEMVISYTVKTLFREKPDVPNEDLNLKIDLPIAVPPNQTPKLVSAGIALSQYIPDEDYSSTAVRQRLLWLEFDNPPANPKDTYFVRVLSSAPDPMLTRGAEVSLPPEPPLPIDPEHFRVIRPNQPRDSGGMDAMQQLIPTDSACHFLLPLPPGLHESSRELFGFFTYELRVGHLAEWSLAKARFGPSQRVTGVMHPAPPLHCSTVRTAKSVRVSAPFAAPVFSGQSLLPRIPATQLWMLLYAQVMQTDGKSNRNLLLSRRRVSIEEVLKENQNAHPDYVGNVKWDQDEIEKLLKSYSLPACTPLSAMAVELLPELESFKDPLGSDLGKVRILRASNLTKVSAVCIRKPCP